MNGAVFLLSFLTGVFNGLLLWTREYTWRRNDNQPVQNPPGGDPRY